MNEATSSSNMYSITIKLYVIPINKFKVACTSGLKYKIYFYSIVYYFYRNFVPFYI